MIVVVCGPPGVGKTTVATRLVDRLRDGERSVDLIHSDDFSRRTYERMYERVTSSGGDWILDGTFYRRAWREQFRALDGTSDPDSRSESSGDVFVVRLHASLDTCLARNRDRDDPIDERGVHVIYREFEGGGEDLTLNADALSPEEMVDRIASALDGDRPGG